MPWLNEKVRGMMVIHEDISTLYEYVDKRVLPEELGGDGGPLDNSAAAIAISNMRGHLQALETYFYHDR